MNAKRRLIFLLTTILIFAALCVPAKAQDDPEFRYEVTVDGEDVIELDVGDVITVNETSRSSEKFKSLVELMQTRIVPKWLEVDKENAVAKVVAQFEREDLDFPVEEQLVVELYSK